MRYEAANRADGIILLGYGDYVTYGERLRALAAAGAHYVIWGPTIDEQPGHSVGCDNHFGTRLVTEHLIKLGRRQIAFIGESSDHYPEFKLRHDGYRDALQAAGLVVDPQLQCDAETREASGFAAMQTLLANGKSFDGVVAASDLIAIGAIKALRNANLNVPGDVSVVGFDDIPAASYVTPALTTVHQDTDLAGALLVERLLQLIDGEQVASDLVKPSLVIRESCGANEDDA